MTNENLLAKVQELRAQAEQYKQAAENAAKLAAKLDAQVDHITSLMRTEFDLGPLEARNEVVRLGEEIVKLVDAAEAAIAEIGES